MYTPISSRTFRDNRLDLFWWFVYERQSIWHRRFARKLPPPWTQDLVMQRERFTNVYRELDPGTQYAIQRILEVDAPKADKIFNVMLYRLIGRAETHAEIGFQRLQSFDPTHLERTLKSIRDDKDEPPFTAAYMVSAYVKMGSYEKIENVVRLFAQLHRDFASFHARIESCTRADAVYDVLRSAYGFGNFLAYQVLVDLLYPLRAYVRAPLLPYSHDDWASAGPGARRGIEMLLQEDARVSHLDVMRWLRRHQLSEFGRLGLEFPYLVDGQGKQIEISLANIQNCLCEFHKYVKISEGTGRGRRKFTPSTSSAVMQLSFDLDAMGQPR
jgi:hypothetical protein